MECILRVVKLSSAKNAPVEDTYPFHLLEVFFPSITQRLLWDGYVGVSSVRTNLIIGLSRFRDARVPISDPRADRKSTTQNIGSRLLTGTWFWRVQCARGLVCLRTLWSSASLPERGHGTAKEWPASCRMRGSRCRLTNTPLFERPWGRP